ncbi:MAG: hypothetical protein KatS3mg052_1657 [Candidatus Roseilinea sp.]|nr:MAG: hypothetical protein KatS3mg052_1657 [Candidatus Roseilinea sp.]
MSPAIATLPGIELSVGQHQALDDVLAALDRPGMRRAIGLFGPRGSGKTTLLSALCRGGASARRTPQHRKVVCALINAANLPTDLAPWQRLIFGVLDKLAQQPGAPATVQELRAELEEVVQHEANDDASATLAAAAFAHHMRAAFAGMIHSAITLSNATFVVAIDHLDKATPESIAQLLEASKYFLNAQHCATLICADQSELIQKLGDAAMLRAWLTDQVELRASAHPTHREAAILPPTQPARTPPRPIASDIPPLCVQLFTDILGSDRYAIERAGEHWRAAMRALAKRNAAGYHTDVSGAMIAKLCALRVLSPALFDAIRLDAPALTTLERRARLQDSARSYPDEWTEALERDPRLARLFAAAPSFIGVDARHLATALRLVHTGDEATVRQTKPLTAQPVGGGVKLVALNRPRPHGRPAAPASSAPIWTPITVAAGVFIMDRLIKLAVQSVEGLRSGASVPGGLIGLQPPPEANLVEIGLTIGVTLVGLALCILIAAFAGRRIDGRRAKAYGLIAGGLTTNLFDRATYGAAMNYLHIANLPVFNLAHLALLVGAAMLAVAILTHPSHAVRSHHAGDLDHE